MQDSKGFFNTTATFVNLFLVRPSPSTDKMGSVKLAVNESPSQSPSEWTFAKQDDGRLELATSYQLIRHFLVGPKCRQSYSCFN